MPTGTPVLPDKLTLELAAYRLKTTKDAVRGLVALGILTAIRPSGKGQGKRSYFDPAEVEAYALGGEAGIREWRKKQAKKAK